MDLREHALPARVAGLAEEAIATVRRWAGATGTPTPAVESRLSGLLAEEGGPAFAIGFVEGVLRPSDPTVAGRNLERLSRAVPRGLRWYASLGTQLAGGFAPLVPAPIVPLARDAFLRSVGHLLLRLESGELEKQLADLAERGGIRPVLVPVMAVPSGDREAHRQATDARELLLRSDVGAISLGLAGVVGRIRSLELDRVVDAATERLAPLYELAASATGGKSIDLDVGRLDELEPALRLLERMSALHPGLETGISLPACLPDSLPALERVVDLARRRRASGGAGITVRITRGERLGEEIADAERHGWAPAPFPDRLAADAQFLRMLDFALTPARSSAVRVVSATHDLFTTAFAWRLARARGVERGLEHEFMLGMATAQVEAVKRDVGGVRLAVPIVQPGQLALATPYLVRRLHDLSDADGLPAVAARLGSEEVLAAEAGRFLAALAEAPRRVPATNRTQDPQRSAVADFTLPAARDWAHAVLSRARDSAAGEDLIARSALSGEQELEALIVGTRAAGASWGERRGSTRATVIESVAEVLAEWRGLLVECAVSERGLTIEEADDEVTIAIAVAHRAAHGARELEAVAEAAFVPPKLVVVASPRWSPIAETAGAVLQALAAGAGVILKTAPETRRGSAVLIETLLAAGVPSGLVALLDDEGDLARRLLIDDRVDRILHFGSRHAAKRFHSWRAEAPLVSTTGGRNAIVVTPSADLETAVSDIVESAFDHAGQAPTAVSAVILVGSVGESDRFLGRLADAISSLPAAKPGAVGISALARPASGGVLEALEELGPGERWFVRPIPLDESGRLWSPGLRDGVGAGSAFRRRENRAPVLGIMRAATLAEAIELQNSTGFGLAAGLQSLDPVEVATWLEFAEAGLLCVNRPVVSGLRARVPVGGWNRSIIGQGAAAGGQDAVLALGSWEPRSAPPVETVTLEGMGDPVARLIGAAQSGMDFAGFDRVRAGARSDEAAWRSVYAPRDLAGLDVERSVQRYRPVAVTIRLSEGEPTDRLVRVLAAAAIAHAAVAVSTATPLHADLIDLFGERDSPVGVAEVLVESDARWHARVQAGELATTRVRLLGGDPVVLARVLHGQPGVAVIAGPATASGRVELLTFLREQSVVVSTSRHGYPEPELAALPIA
jgi:RHH-type proline utilization regulon transcriptional repressor/proline dehydrogenase/delta 1-pyrroline-5-carboxylate dehydrogenase